MRIITATFTVILMLYSYSGRRLRLKDCVDGYSIEVQRHYKLTGEYLILVYIQLLRDVLRCNCVWKLQL